jgi:hypothetical protein
MKPRSILVAGSLVFGAGLLCLAALVGIGWLAKILFSFEVGVWTVYGLVMAGLLLLYRTA